MEVNMANKKYEQYVLTDFPPVESEETNYKSALIMDTEGVKTFKGKNFSIAASFITDPGVMVSEPHAHDYDQYLIFIGSDLHSKSLGGEAEMCLGKEQEKYIINTSAIVHIPKGLVHCPLTHKRVDKPYLLLDIFLATKYKRNLSK
jgi:hypothetical protein